MIKLLERGDDIEEAKSAVEKLKENDEHFEGFVLRDYHNNRVKLKSAEYMELFFIKGDGVFSNRKILELILKEQDDDVVSNFPEYKDDFDTIRRAFSIWIQGVKDDLNVAVTKHTLDKKTFAEWAKTTINPSIMFRIYGTKNWDETWLKRQVEEISLDRLLVYIGMKERK